jgi:hypothetical protein
MKPDPAIKYTLTPAEYTSFLTKAGKEGSVTREALGGKMVIDGVSITWVYMAGVLTVADYDAPFYVGQAAISALLDTFGPVKSSGIDGDAGDWTAHGDGKAYPAAAPDWKKALGLKG